MLGRYMLRFRFFFAASLIAPALLTLSPLPVLADSWDSLASISAEPTARYVCYGNADGKNITCDSTAPYVDATGNVGIGTTSPSTILDARGVITAGASSSTNGSVLLQGYYSSTAATTVIGTEYSTGAPIIGYGVTPSTSAAGSFLSSISTAATRGAIIVGDSIGGVGSGMINFYTGTSQTVAVGSPVTTSLVMSIKNTGLVGIGTNNPSTILSFGGDAARTVGMERGTVAATAGYALTLQAGGATSGSTDKNGGDLVLSSGTATGTGTSKITFKTHPAGSTGMTDTTATTAMTILGSGNIGIGTTSVAWPYRLGISDTTSAFVLVDGNTSAATPALASLLRLNSNIDYRGKGMYLSTTDAAANAAWFVGVPYTGGGFQIGQSSVHDPTSVNNSGYTSSAKFFINSSGNIGIGTATVNHKLDVNGNIGLAASSYVNWGATDGTTGYGFRDNAGALEFKNSGGSWTPFGTSNSFAAGTVSAPGLYVTGDSDTGFYQATANTLSITAGGVEAARFNTATSGVNYLSVTPSATGAAVQLAPAGSDTNISLAIMPKGTGNVGIGTASPTQKLEVQGSIHASTSTSHIGAGANGNPYINLFQDNSTGTAGVGANLYFDGSNWVYANTSAWGGNGAVWRSYPGSYSLRVSKASNAANPATLVDQFTILTNGNVGIGTTSPNEYLEVAGAAARAIVSDGAGANRRGLLLIGPISGTDYGRIEAYGYGTSGGGKNLVINNVGGGNVGIGTTTPAEKLDVNGVVKVAGTGSETCATAADLGKIRLNPATGRIQICRQ